jgi:hypothetical protein
VLLAAYTEVLEEARSAEQTASGSAGLSGALQGKPWPGGVPGRIACGCCCTLHTAQPSQTPASMTNDSVSAPAAGRPASPHVHVLMACVLLNNSSLLLAAAPQDGTTTTTSSSSYRKQQQMSQAHRHPVSCSRRRATGGPIRSTTGAARSCSSARTGHATPQCIPCRTWASTAQTFWVFSNSIKRTCPRSWPCTGGCGARRGPCG